MRRAGLWRAAALAVAAILPTAALAADSSWCKAPPGWTAILPPLEHTAARLDAGGPLEIVAVGSSSTVGVGATGPDESYPALLQTALQQSFPRIGIHVANRGRSGEDAPEEHARLAADVVAAHPDLVIWQVGTNAVLRRDDLSADGTFLLDGINLMKNAGSDVVMMDLQYAPQVLDRPSYGVMEELIADTANAANVGLFRRFALMRYWQSTHPADAPAMIGPDGLHMTDAGYACLAHDLAAQLKANWQANEKLARRPHGRNDALAGLRDGVFGDIDALGGSPPPPVRRKDAKPID